jgi:hypothetical protein
MRLNQHPNRSQRQRRSRDIRLQHHCDRHTQIWLLIVQSGPVQKSGCNVLGFVITGLLCASGSVRHFQSDDAVRQTAVNLGAVPAVD